MKKGFIFDLDGTLLDTVESIAHSANTMLTEFGYKPHEKDCYKYFAGDGQEELIQRALKAAGDTNLSDFEAGLARYRELFKEGCMYHVAPFDGMVEALHTLKDKGMKLAVFSNKADVNVQHIIATLFEPGLFDFVLGARPDYKRKPSREGVDIVLKELNLDSTECIYVGDTSTDMLTGKGAKLYTVGVLWGFRDEKELMENGADVIIKKPEELTNLV
jgi:phosphoglycolate phosphatase